ncbi:uncharacterized protein LOC116203413 [Punica granatum]|uniref:Uncharacterized protein n=2 Tax=Punica granatum TaxID=22663 RepID=A0A2I0J646_PUNGR|nr:uncharacterized protein LOC116203413 [Punica granatum]PKI51708.1 hypothetical protein CRG98_027871 [Punica granatum]
MCRSTDFPNFRSGDRDRLKIRGFYVRLPDADSRRPFPESLTLLYLPRISENSLEIDGSKIRPDLPAFVTLHRVVSEDGGGAGGAAASYGSRDRVCASEGLMFEVYAGEEKALKGVFRRDEYGEWAVDCRCAIEGARGGGEAEVCVEAEGHVTMVERVEMVAARRRFRGLEEIPEEREEVAEDEQVGSCCCCSCSEGDSGSDGGDVMEFSGWGGDVEECTEEIRVSTEGVRWAVDVGIWVMCVGVGVLVSRASARRLRRRRLI